MLFVFVHVIIWQSQQFLSRHLNLTFVARKKKKKLLYKKEDTRSVNPPIHSQPCNVWTKLMSGYWWTSTHRGSTKVGESDED